MPKIRSVKTALTRSLKANPTRRRTVTSGPTTAEDNVLVLIRTLKVEYEKHRCPANAVAMKKYMRGQFDYFGMKSAERRNADKRVIAACNNLTYSEIPEMIRLLWKAQEREYQYFAFEYAMKFSNVFLGPDVKSCQESLECVREMITEKSWWDTVDLIASKLLGVIVLRYPSTFQPVMDTWIEDPNMWIRRSAILHQLNYKEKTHKNRLFKYSLHCCHEKEFFIQKSIGWALRQYFRTNPTDVKKFVKDNQSKLAKLSVKEALKHA